MMKTIRNEKKRILRQVPACELFIGPGQGGAKSPLWRQICADVFNCPVVSPFTEEAGALGWALQAMWCWYNEKKEPTAIQSITDRFVKLDPKTLCDPESSAARIYENVFQKYLELNTALTPCFQ